MIQASIVHYWQAVELLQPQAAPAIKKRDKNYEAFFHDISAAAPVLPWSANSPLAREAIRKGRVWSHTLFCHLYDSRDIAKKLAELYGEDEGYKEPQKRDSALFSVKFDASGHMIDESLVLSSEAWFLAKAMANKDWTRGFDEDQDAVRARAKAHLGGEVTDSGIIRLTNFIRKYLGLESFFGPLGKRSHRVRSMPTNPSKPELEDDPLNSFIMGDLADVGDSLAIGISSAPLTGYLSLHDSAKRLHISEDRNSRALVERLFPTHYSKGCWPAEKHLGLVHSQQLAVNTILTELANSEGLLGINGPPGTGKTTLLRDLIAAIVTQRADVLASFARPSEAFLKNGREKANSGGKELISYNLNPKLYGHEIVVASSNNGAVENVTLELPQRDKIDESWLKEADYFSEIGELVTGKPAWGLISAALGSKAKRTQFVSRFFYGDSSKDVPKDTKANDIEPNLDEIDVEAPEDEPTPEPEYSGTASEAKSHAKGFLDWLSKQIDLGRTKEQHQSSWESAVEEYKTAISRANKLSASAAEIGQIIEAFLKTDCAARQKEESLQLQAQKLAAAKSELATLQKGSLPIANNNLRLRSVALQNHQNRKPGFWANLFSFWGAYRRWAALLGPLQLQYDLAKKAHQPIASAEIRLHAEQMVQEKLQRDGQDELKKLREHAQTQFAKARALAITCQAVHLLSWLDTDVIGRGNEIELAEPWIIKDWRQARAKVFLQALQLHRTFFQIEAKRIRANLRFVTDMLGGGRYSGVSRDAIRSVWASLFMVVPVLSSTFASFARSFGSLNAGEIGWLLVDEAGQATPQAAVGALWRSRRAVLVGDPLQLPPIISVSDAALEHMRKCFGVGTHWLPNRQSAQTLADQATPWGNMLGPRDSKNWVGLPLVVHRRCDRPMFDLANRIAYDNAMVYGTLAPSPAKETKAKLSTGWIHATGISTGNWVDAEGDALQHLMARLKDDGVPDKDISVITPFQDVRRRLNTMLPEETTRGTIHTMQGKEAPVVIMVLGGNTASPGARDWVVSTPNLLNVAATRAKRRFYVIGDRDDWANRPLFCDVMDLLPARARVNHKLDNAPLDG
ncbi:AAA domain-containing protein [Pseudomonas sp. YH-1]|uniref:DEAD/DEAH box helicase n=1 Tax=Pseudomonas sp. YH-1 TaxID=3384787 RepID=UPI003F7EDD7B